MQPSLGNDAFTGMPAFCHMMTRASHMMPTSISPVLNGGPPASVEG